MKKSTKRAIMVIGSLSIIAGLYGAFTGGEFKTYSAGIFFGVVLIGSAWGIIEEDDEPNFGAGE